MAKVRVFLSFEFDKDEPLHRNFYEQAREHSCYAIRAYSIIGRYAEDQGATEVVLPPPLEVYDDTGRSESAPDESAGDRAPVGTGQAGSADAVPIQDAGDSEVDAGDAGTGTDSGESESTDATVAADERDGAGEGDGAVPAPSGPGASGTVSGAGTPGPGGGTVAPDTGTQPAVAGLTEAQQAAVKLAEQILGQTSASTTTPTTAAKPAATQSAPATAPPATEGGMTPERAAAGKKNAAALLDEFFPDDDILSESTDATAAAADTGTQPAVAGLSPTAQAGLDLANRILNKESTPAAATPKPTTTRVTPKTPAVAKLTPAELAAAEAHADALLDEFFPDDDILSDIVENAERVRRMFQRGE